jgi:hypothetical protein
MANEIAVVLQIRCTNGVFRQDFPSRTFNLTQATAGGAVFTQSIGTSEENITFTDITPGLVVIWNLDATNYVEVGKSDAGTMKEIIKLLPQGPPAMFVVAAGETIRALANTGACVVQVSAWNA